MPVEKDVLRGTEDKFLQVLVGEKFVPPTWQCVLNLLLEAFSKLHLIMFFLNQERREL